MTLTAAELSAIQTVQEAALPDTCTIQTRTLAADGVGGKTETWANTYLLVPCRLAPASGDERLSADRKTVFARYTLTVAHDQVITETSQVVHGGVTYRVLFVDSDKSWNTARRVTLERID